MHGTRWYGLIRMAAAPGALLLLPACSDPVAGCAATQTCVTDGADAAPGSEGGAARTAPPDGTGAAGGATVGEAPDDDAGPEQDATTPLDGDGPDGPRDPGPDAEPSEPDAGCASGACAACAEGERRCDGAGAPERCSAGVWVTEARCAGATPLCAAGACGAPRVEGGLATTTRSALATAGGLRIRSQGLEYSPRACDTTRDICIRGGIAP